MKNGPQWLDRRVAAPGPYLALCLAEHEFKALIQEFKAPDPGPWISTPQADATAHLLANQDGRRCCIICVREWRGRDPIELAGLLIHEAVHVWQCHADDIGERRPGDEQEAYAIQAIAQELLAEFARRMREDQGAG